MDVSLLALGVIPFYNDSQLNRNYDHRLGVNKGGTNDVVICHKHIQDNKGFFSKPKLVVEHDEKYESIYAPERTYQPQNIHRKFLRIYVGNKGGSIARRCTAILMVRPTVEQQYPAVQEVALTWEGLAGDVNMNTSIEKDIQPNSKALLHIVFSDSTFPNTYVDPPTPIHAVISSKDILDTFDNQHIVVRGFIVGDFIVRITVTSNNAKSHKSYFNIHVDTEWDKLYMKRLNWLKTKALSLKHSQ
jgi:hypothetical protein